jgi:hypothetical protein
MLVIGVADGADGEGVASLQFGSVFPRPGVIRPPHALLSPVLQRPGIGIVLAAATAADIRTTNKMFVIRFDCILGRDIVCSLPV